MRFTSCELFVIENAPQIDVNTDEEVVQFIDGYVTCELPSEDDGSLDIVKTVQHNSKRHSKSGRKRNTVCRFNFPRPASGRTFICHSTEDQTVCKCQEDVSEGDW